MDFYNKNIKMIGGKLLTQGGFGCVFHPEVSCDGEDTTNEKFVTKIQKRNFSADNEIRIGEKLKKRYGINTSGEFNPLKTNFAPIISSCPINISKLNVKDDDKCNIFTHLKKQSEDTTLLMLKIRYLNSADYDDYIISSKDMKNTIVSIISDYNYLLKSVSLLIDTNIVHFDLKGPNIVYDFDMKVPIIIDFGLSMPMTEVTFENIRDYFYVYAPDYFIWPLEVHYLNYLLHVNKEPTEEKLKLISANCVNLNRALEPFSDNFKIKFKEECFKKLLEYNKLPFKDRVRKILTFWQTWDNYSISIMFLNIIIIIAKSAKGFIKNNFIKHFIVLLMNNIHPDPDRRFDVLKSMKEFNRFLFSKNVNKTEIFQGIISNIEKNRVMINKALLNNSKNLKMITQKIEKN
jgi:serine/threonine protein kinase